MQDKELLDDLLDSEELPMLSYPIRIDDFDKYLADQMRESSPNWQNVEKSREPEYDKVPQVMDTLFNGLFQARPMPVPDEQLTKTGKTLRDLLQAVQNTKEWKELRYDTRHDEVTSAIATAVLGKSIELPPPEPPGDPDDDAKEPGDGGTEGEPNDGSLTDAQMDAIRQSARTAMREAAKEIDEQKTMEGLLWGDGLESSKGQDAQTRLEFAKKMKANPRLKSLAELLGRFRIMADQKYRQRVNHGRDELADIVLGDSLSDMIPEEMIKLALEELEVIFLLQYAEKRLMQYHFESTEKMGKGPIVSLVDISGSMSETLSGGEYYGLKYGSPQKIDWALANALALSVFAKKEKRNLTICLFNGGIVKTWFFPKGEWQPEHIFEIGSFGAMGGTNFELPLQYAMDRIAEDENDKADIIFLTDGIAPVSAEFMQKYKAFKELKQFKTLGVLLHYGSCGILEALCDDVTTISDLKSGAKAQDMLFNL